MAEVSTLDDRLDAPQPLLGRSNWWLPRPLERWMARLHVEGRSEAFLSRSSTKTKEFSHA